MRKLCVELCVEEELDLSISVYIINVPCHFVILSFNLMKHAVCSRWDLEFGVEDKPFLSGFADSLDINNVGPARWDDTWDWESHSGGPHLGDSASWACALRFAGGVAVLGVPVNRYVGGAGLVAYEVEVVKIGGIDVPDTRDDEFLSVVDLNGIGVSIGARSRKHGEILNARSLSDYDGIVGGEVGVGMVHLHIGEGDGGQ